MIEKIVEMVDFLDKVTIIFAFVIMIVTIKNLLHNRRQLEKINIFFLLDDKEIPINLSIIRQHISRAEIMGILGIIQKNSREKYNVTYLSKKEFLEDIYKIQKGKLDRLVIKVTKEEMSQFDIETKD